MKRLKRVVIKEEFVELTGDFIKALILNQFLYWTERVKDFDQFIREEKERATKEGIEVNILESGGWIYKTGEELLDELMINTTIKTFRKHLKELIEMKYLHERKNPHFKWDQTKQYRVDLVKINNDLLQKGLNLQGYKLKDLLEEDNSRKGKSLHDQFAFWAE